MQKGMDVLGLPVLDVQKGQEVGNVRDILLDEISHTLGIVLQEIGWFQSGRYVPFANIVAIGKDYVTIMGKEAITSMRTLANQETVGLISGKQTLKGKQVITENGENLGRVEDVYFSVDWAKLVGYELSDGWIADVIEGRKRLPVTPSATLGKEALVVPNTNRI